MKYNIRFAANFLAHVIVINYENWFTNKQSYCKNKKGVVFLETHCIGLGSAGGAKYRWGIKISRFTVTRYFLE